MDHQGTLEEGRDDRADARDESGYRRDLTSDERDKASDRRDGEAGERDAEDSHRTHDLADRYRQLRRHVLDHFAGIENSTIDPADWPDLTPAALDQLQALVAQQRHAAARSQAVILTVLDELDAQSHHTRTSRVAAARDRRAAADDRRRSVQDRAASADDRDHSAADRNQAVIEREQTDSGVTVGQDHRGAPAAPAPDHATGTAED